MNNFQKIKSFFIENRSPIAPVLGLGYRKLDVFGYYKFVTAVKNINLLPKIENLFFPFTICFSKFIS